MRKTSPVFVLLMTVAAGCPGTTGGARGGASGQGGGDAPPVVLSQGDCAPDNLTAACTCESQGNSPGQQVCTGGRWSACACDATDTSSAGTGGSGGSDGSPAGSVSDPPGNLSAERFDWQRTPFELGSCKAGHYVGYFDGFYGSPAAFTAPVPVVSAAGADGAPGLEFWLNKVPGSGELFRVEKGKIRGTANGLFPFTIDLTGDLDCATKKFIGKLENGVYDVAGTKYMFEGSATADYDKVQNQFIGGKWDAKEPTSPFPTAGGSGMWNAQWQAN